MVNGTFVKSKLKDAETFGADSGTVTIDLPRSNYLATLLLKVYNVNGTTSNTATTIQGDIDKIEIIADGTVIYSMRGRDARRFEHFDAGEEPPANETQEASAVQWAMFPIKFGRHKSDKQLILPAHKFESLQMKITYSFTDSATEGFTTSESNAHYHLIAKYLVSNELQNTPFLMKKEIYSKTPTSTGTEEINCPVGAGNGAYRRILLTCYEAGIADGTDLTDYEVLVNESQRIMAEEWITSQLEDFDRYGATHTKFVNVVRSNTDTYTSFVGNITSAVATAESPDSNATITTIAGDTLTFGLYDTATPTALTTDDVIRTAIRSYGVSFCTMIDFGTEDIRDCIDVSRGSNISSLKVKYTVGAIGGDTRAISEQLIRL